MRVVSHHVCAKYESTETCARIFKKSHPWEKAVPLKVLFTEALEAKLASAENKDEPWRRHFGALKGLRAESRRIEKVMEREFEGVDREAWR